MSAAVPISDRITGWDRAAIVALGAAGCALSYDALQQMAVAIHIRGFLTYLFPLVIDGFIAYGVRALVVLRTASFPARLYVWTLFGTATAASIWANALHAVRLNEQHTTVGRLRLGDTTVGVLSTLAPLALAGAVHLYILIARRVSEETISGHLGHLTAAGHPAEQIQMERAQSTEDGQTANAGQFTSGHRPALLTDGPGQSADRKQADSDTLGQGARTPADQSTPGQEATSVTGPVTKAVTEAARRGTTSSGGSGDLVGRSGGRPVGEARLRGDQRVGPAPEGTPSTGPNTNDDRATDPVTEQLLPIARKAVAETGRTTRAVVAEAIRGQGLPLSNDRLTELMRTLRDNPGQPTDGRVD